MEGLKQWADKSQFMGSNADPMSANNNNKRRTSIPIEGRTTRETDFRRERSTMGDSCGETPSDEEIARWTTDEESSRSTTTCPPRTSTTGQTSVTTRSSSLAAKTSTSAIGPLDEFQKDTQSKYERNANKNCAYVELQKLNPHISTMDEDILYHIALGNKSHDLQKMFKDVQFVVMGGTPKRMEQFAYFVMKEIGYELQPGTILNDISKHSHRYAMYKVGPVLSVSHGMGMPSIGILLHELIKLMHHAGVRNPKFFRIGTCGGFNKKAGTVVVSEGVVNDYFEPVYELPILGTIIRFPATLDKSLANEIMSFASPQDNFESVMGKTYSTDSFYEGSGRADGAICEFSDAESREYYNKLSSIGVVNVEMEALAFAALTCRAGIKSAVICVILSDRLETDQIKQPKHVLDEWQTRPQKLLIRYIKKSLSITKPEITAAIGKVSLAESPTGTFAGCIPLCSKSDSSSSCIPILCGKGSSESSKLTQPTGRSISSTTTSSTKTCQPKCCTESTEGSETSTSQDVSLQTPKTAKSSIKSSGCPQLCSKSFDTSSLPQRTTVPGPESRAVPSTTSSSQKTPASTKECLPCIGARESVKQYFSQEKTQESWRACYKICGMDSDKSDSTITPTPSLGVAATSAPAEKRSVTSTPQECYCGPPRTSAIDSGKPSESYKVSGFDKRGGASSTLSEPRRSFYLECAKLSSCDKTSKIGAATKSEPTPKSERKLSFFTPKQVITKEGAEETRPCCGKSEDIRSPRTCAEEQKYLEERKEQEVDHTPPTRAESAEILQRRRFSIPKPVDDPRALGPCCAKDFVEKSPAPVGTFEIGPCCLGLKEEESSPECSTVTQEIPDDPKRWRMHDAPATEIEEPRTSDDRPVSRSTDDSPTSPRGVFQTLSCPLNISCKSRTGDNDTSKTTAKEHEIVPSPETPKAYQAIRGPTFTSTPMPKIDQTKVDIAAIVTPPAGPVKTPDTPCCHPNNVPAFITPTSTVAKTPISACCLKYRTESGQQATTIDQPPATVYPSTANYQKLIFDGSEYDESPSPCAACKKYQETKNRNPTGTPSDSQPEIIKCRHKFRRLKEECEGYD